MEFTLTDRAERATRIIINDSTVHFSGSIRDEAPDWHQSEITYPTAFLLELIEDMISTPDFAFTQLALYGNTQVAIRPHESQEDVVELHVGTMFEEGAGLCIPMSVIRAVLGGGEAAPRS